MSQAHPLHDSGAQPPLPPNPDFPNHSVCEVQRGHATQSAVPSLQGAHYAQQPHAGHGAVYQHQGPWQATPPWAHSQHHQHSASLRAAPPPWAPQHVPSNGAVSGHWHMQQPAQWPPQAGTWPGPQLYAPQQAAAQHADLWHGYAPSQQQHPPHWQQQWQSVPGHNPGGTYGTPYYGWQAAYSMTPGAAPYAPQQAYQPAQPAQQSLQQHTQPASAAASTVPCVAQPAASADKQSGGEAIAAAINAPAHAQQKNGADAHTQAPDAPPTQSIDAAQLFLPPARSSRPRAFVVLIRGVPGSGKSWLADKLRTLEVLHGGKPPRILSIDAYFMAGPDDGAASGAKHEAQEVYVHDAAMEGRYEASMVQKLAQTVADGQHPLVLVDSPMLQASRVHAFWAAAKAAGVEVYVTHPLHSDAATCHAHNVHRRSLEDTQAAEAALEPAPAAIVRLDCTEICGGEAAPPLPPSSSSAAQSRVPLSTGKPKRKFAEAPDVAAAAAQHSKHARSANGCAVAQQSPTNDVVAPPAAALSDAELLASVNAGLASPGGKGGGSAASKSRWEADNDDASDSDAPAAASAPQQATLDARLRALLAARPRGKQRKHVRWPDQIPEEEEDVAFRLGRPRQLETVHLLDDLGPGASGVHAAFGNDHLSFEAAVRAEHSAEKAHTLRNSHDDP